MMWSAYDRDLTPESYMDEYITAEIPQLPDERDNTPAAIAQRDYHDFVVNKLYHTCAVNRCKATPRDKCTKRFPVISNHHLFILYSFLFRSHFLNSTLRERTVRLCTVAGQHLNLGTLLILQYTGMKPIFQGTIGLGRTNMLCHIIGS